MVTLAQKLKRRHKNFRIRKLPLAVKVAKLTRQVSAMKPEQKHYDVFGGTPGVLTYSNTLTTANCLFPCRDIVQGDGDFGERIGDKIRITSWYLTFNLLLQAPTVYDIARITIVQFKTNSDGATAQASFINQYFNSSSAASTYQPLALLDWDNRGSFRTLYDKSFNLTSALAGGASPAALSTGKRITIKIVPPKVGREVTYFNGSSTPCKNEIFAIFQSRSNAATTVMEYNTRLVYTDV